MAEKEISYFSRTRRELETLGAHPLLHPYFYLDRQRLRAVKEDIKFSEAFHGFSGDSEFKEARRHNVAIVEKIIEKAKEFLEPKQAVASVKEEKISLPKNIDDILKAKKARFFTKEEEFALNLVFYEMLEQYRYVFLPKTTNKNGEKVIDEYECYNLFHKWAEEADQLITSFVRERIGPTQPLTLPEETKAVEPYELMLLASRVGEAGYHAGRKLGLIKIFAKLSQLVSGWNTVELPAALDFTLRRKIKNVLEHLKGAVFVSRDKDGESQEFERVKITSYLDPEEEYRSRIISYFNPAQEPETIFSVGHGLELIIEQDISTLLASFNEWKDDIGKLVEQPIITRGFQLFKREYDLSDEHYYEALKDFFELVRLSASGKFVKAQREEECRMMLVDKLHGRRKSDEKRERSDDEKELIYITIATREKERQAAVIKAIRRGYRDLSRIDDILGLSCCYLNHRDAKRAYEILERGIGGEQFDSHDNFIRGGESVSSDPESSEWLKMQKYKTRINRLSENGEKEETVLEVQQTTFLASELGISREAHWRYRLRQYFANFLRIIYPPEFYGERFNLAGCLDQIKRHYFNEYNDFDRLRNNYETDAKDYEKMFDGEPYPYDISEYAANFYPRHFFREKLYRYVEQTRREGDKDSVVSDIDGLLTLEGSALQNHPLKETITHLKGIWSIIRYRTKSELERILRTVDTSSRSWYVGEHRKEIEHIVDEATLDFILDTLRTISQEDGMENG